MRRKKIVKIIFLLPVCYLLLLLAISISLTVVPLPIDNIEKDYSTVHLASNDELLRITLSPSQKYRVKLKLNEMSEYLKNGFLLYEDRFFFKHYGINPVSLSRALITNIRNKKVVLGASTITMQIAKMMEPRPRTLRSKIIEIFRTIQLERKYSKKELLEMYLNIVPMGGNIEGVGAASYLYFGKPAKNLTLGESSLLIALPKSPSIYRPDIFPENAKKQRCRVLNRIGEKLGKFQEMIQKAMIENISEKRFDNPYQVPNLIVRNKLIGPEFIKRYTINIPLQKYCEDIIAKTIKKLENYKCYNGAMIIIDNRTMNVLVYVGSADFNDFKHGGQINCANIKRSPGSLLKPFLYSMGIEKGIITPQKILFDIERNYDGYNPINFDKKFIGPISAEEALINSLNVPAVNLEYELGKDGLNTFLNRAHIIDEERQTPEVGLSLVLGAYPLTLEELVRLYSCLANEGKLRELNFFKDYSYRNEGSSILSPETCFLISTMLSKVERTDLPQSWEFSPTRGKIAFKTGTSFGLRDAWCIGYNPDYTVGVWLGNVDCKSSSVLIGIKVAAPIVVETFNYLTRYTDSWFKKPEDVQERKVCAVSGDVAGNYCEKTVTDYYIPGVSNNRVCSVHRQIYIRKSDSLEVCRYCMTGSIEEYTTKIVEVWPPDVASYLRRSGAKITDIVKHNPKCDAIDENKGLKIKNPVQNSYYTISEALPIENQKILLNVQSETSCETVYWFVDDRLYAQGSSDNTFYLHPSCGKHIITVMDSRGQFDSVKINVERADSKVAKTR